MGKRSIIAVIAGTLLLPLPGAANEPPTDGLRETLAEIVGWIKDPDPEQAIDDIISSRLCGGFVFSLNHWTAKVTSAEGSGWIIRSVTGTYTHEFSWDSAGELLSNATRPIPLSSPADEGDPNVLGYFFIVADPYSNAQCWEVLQNEKR